MKQAASIAIVFVLVAPAGSGQQPSAPLPVSTLPLRLVGVARDASAPTRSAALIACGDLQKKRSAWLFAVGDRACSVAEVREILEDAVVIRNLLANRLELLTLPKAGVPSVPSSLSPGEASVETGSETAPRPLVRAASNDLVTVELRQEMLDRYLSNLPEVLSSALATPRYATRGSGPPAVEGFEMSRIRAGGIVEQLGLRDGDVLLEFNGRKLDSLAAVMGLFGQAQALSGAKLTVLRNGQRMTFVFSVK
jgi:hypothetical protein